MLSLDILCCMYPKHFAYSQDSHHRLCNICPTGCRSTSHYWDTLHLQYNFVLIILLRYKTANIVCTLRCRKLGDNNVAASNYLKLVKNVTKM